MVYRREASIPKGHYLDPIEEIVGLFHKYSIQSRKSADPESSAIISSTDYHLVYLLDNIYESPCTRPFPVCN